MVPEKRKKQQIFQVFRKNFLLSARNFKQPWNHKNIFGGGGGGRRTNLRHFKPRPTTMKGISKRGLLLIPYQNNEISPIILYC